MLATDREQHPAPRVGADACTPDDCACRRRVETEVRRPRLRCWTHGNKRRSLPVYRSVSALDEDRGVPSSRIEASREKGERGVQRSRALDSGVLRCIRRECVYAVHQGILVAKNGGFVSGLSPTVRPLRRMWPDGTRLSFPRTFMMQNQQLPVT